MRYYTRILVLLLICVLVPCTTVFSVTNYIMQNQYQETVSDSQVSRLQAVNGILRLVIESMEQSALRFSLEPTVQALGGVVQLDSGLRNPTHMRGLKRALDKLNELVRTNNLYHSIYFYIKDSDYVISSQDSTVKLERFVDQEWMERYAQLQQERKTNRMLPARPILTGYADTSGFSNYGRQHLTYVYPITPFTSNFEGALVFNIYEDMLLELYMDRPFSGNLAIFDENGTWLTGVKTAEGDALLQEFDWELVMDENGPRKDYFYSAHKGTLYQYSYLRSADNWFVLLSVEDNSQLMQKTTSFQIIFVIFLLLFVPFIALLVVLLSRRLYSPIAQLARELSASGKLDMSMETDEWSAISLAVRDLLREDHRLFSDTGREKLRNATFLSILSEDIGQNEDDVQEILPYPNNICVIAAIDQSDDKLRKDQSFDSRMRLFLRLVEQGLSGEGANATAMRYEGNTIVTILSLSEKPQGAEGIEEKLQARLRELQQEARTVLEHTVTFAVGGVEDSDGGARRSFERAKSVLEYRFIQGVESILFYDRIVGGTLHYDADERVKYIRHCLYAGKKEEVLQGLEALVGELTSKKYVSFICVSLILNELATTLAEYVIEKEIDLEDLLADHAAIYRQLWKNLTLKEANRWFSEMISVVMDYRQSMETSSGSKYIRDIIEYVKESYTKNIAIESIAEHIGISYSHMRKLFKDATGRNLVDYINTLRIQKAKQLLCETNYTVKEIAAMCGYNHERSFSRAFTHAEGVAPGKYKEMYRLQ